MKKTEPIKRSEHIVSISREHHATLLFCWKLRQGTKHEVELNRISKYVDWFWEHHLKDHFHTEEKLLFTNPNEPKIKKALDEHQNIYQKIMAIQYARQNIKAEQFLELADLIDVHTRYEERELFPWIEQNFELERLIQIGKALDNEEHNADENYEDEFWVKKK